MNLLSVVAHLITCLSYIFLLNTSIFTTTDEKKSVPQVFLKILIKFEDKILEILKHSWLSITWILTKSNSIQILLADIPEIKLLTGPFWTKPNRNSHSIIQTLWRNFTAQKMKFSIKDFFSKCDQLRSFLWIWSHLMKKSLMKIFIFCAVFCVSS